jgi:hypothetical protein
MTFVVRDATAFTKCCDTFSHVSLAQAVALADDGFRAIGLYTHLVDLEDLQNCTSAGLGVFFYIEGLAAGERPTVAIAQTQAGFSVSRLQGLGVPQGVSLSSDLEGAGRAPEDWIAYANTIADVTNFAKHVPTSYIGAGIGLTSAELFALHCRRYIKGASRVMDRKGELAEPTCGWANFQIFPLDVKHSSGLTIDGGMIGQDYAHRTLSLLYAA